MFIPSKRKREFGKQTGEQNVGNCSSGRLQVLHSHGLAPSQKEGTTMCTRYIRPFPASSPTKRSSKARRTQQVQPSLTCQQPKFIQHPRDPSQSLIRHEFGWSLCRPSREVAAPGVRLFPSGESLDPGGDIAKLWQAVVAGAGFEQNDRLVNGHGAHI